MKKCAKCGIDQHPLGIKLDNGCPKNDWKEHQWVEEEPQKAEGCDCADKSCREGCSEDHTHKGFSCDKCHLDACQKEADERPWFADDFDKRFKHVYHPRIQAVNVIQDTGPIIDFISETISESLRRARIFQRGHIDAYVSMHLNDMHSQTYPMVVRGRLEAAEYLREALLLSEAVESIINDNE